MAPRKLREDELALMWQFLIALAGHHGEMQIATNAIVVFLKDIDADALTLADLRRPDIALVMRYQKLLTDFFNGLADLQKMYGPTVKFIQLNEHTAHTAVQALFNEIRAELEKDPDQ
jgi:hypothetical protein